MPDPAIIHVPIMGSPEIGFISVAEQGANVPFEIKRVYWIYGTPTEVIRGAHAHKTLEQLIFPASGVIEVYVETQAGEKMKFVLDSPGMGLYLPQLIWRDIKLTDGAVLLCLASALYNKEDYIRDYDHFKSFNPHQ